jgi:hypothetical protein
MAAKTHSACQSSRHAGAVFNGLSAFLFKDIIKLCEILTSLGQWHSTSAAVRHLSPVDYIQKDIICHETIFFNVEIGGWMAGLGECFAFFTLVWNLEFSRLNRLDCLRRLRGKRTITS